MLRCCHISGPGIGESWRRCPRVTRCLCCWLCSVLYPLVWGLPHEKCMMSERRRVAAPCVISGWLSVKGYRFLLAFGDHYYLLGGCQQCPEEFFCRLICYSSCYSVFWVEPGYLSFHCKIRFITFRQVPVRARAVPGSFACKTFWG